MTNLRWLASLAGCMLAGAAVLGGLAVLTSGDFKGLLWSVPPELGRRGQALCSVFRPSDASTSRTLFRQPASRDVRPESWLGFRATIPQAGNPPSPVPHPEDRLSDPAIGAQAVR